MLPCRRRTRLCAMAILWAVPLGLFVPGRTGAQPAPQSLRLVRIMKTVKAGVGHPGGLAFWPGANAFVVVADRGPQATGLQLVGPFLEPRGAARIPLAFGGVNMTFDAREGRLLALQPESGRLLVVAATPGGTLDPARARQIAVGSFGVDEPQGIAWDPTSGDLFVLDAAQRRIVRASRGGGADWDAAALSTIPLAAVGSEPLRGVALDPRTDHLFVLGAAARKLYELTREGELIAERDLAPAGLREAQGMTFAPSGDLTDDPARTSLYVADTTSIHELALAAATQPAAASSVSPLIATTLTSQFSPPSPDPSGVVYLPASGTLWISDAEVDEMPIYAGANAFETTLDGRLLGTRNTLTFSNEPAGASVNPSDRHLFYSDDDKFKVFEVNAGGDGLYHTSDDVVTSFSTSAFQSNDPEDVVFGNGQLWLCDGVNAEIYRVSPGPNGRFDGIAPAGDDLVAHFDTEALGVLDPEGIAYSGDNGHLYVVGQPPTRVAELTTDGALVQMIDISAAGARKPAGVTYAPSSLDPGQRHLYIVDRGTDNNTDPNENDGKMYELGVPGGAAINAAPAVDAGPDQSITLPAAAALDATVADDGLPSPPGSVTTRWTKLSGPGTVTFGEAGAVDTSASFDVPGTYWLRLTAGDGALTTTDDATITVGGVAQSSPGLSVARVGAIHDTTDASAYSFPPIAASANRLYVVFLSTSVAAGTAPAATGVSGAGLTFTEIGAAGGVSYSSNVRRIQAWRALVGSGATVGSIAVALNGASTDLDAVLLEVSGVDTSGTNGSGAIAQGVSSKGSGVTSLAVGLAPFASPGQRPLAFFNHRAAETVTQEPGYTELDEGVHGSPSAGAQCEWHASSAEDTPSAAWSTAAAAAGFAVVLVPQPAQALPNQAPAVNAGPDAPVSLPAAASLDGTVSDDGLPNPPAAVTTTWTKASGPGTVSFGDASAVDTSATFSEAGSYTLQLTASDGALGSSDQVVITVSAATAQNVAPVVSAGPDQSITLPAAASLDGTVGDDGLPSPPGALSTSWTTVSGPGTVTFGDSSVVDTAASFASAGTYVLRLTAYDGALTTTDDVTITVSDVGQPTPGMTVSRLGAIHDAKDASSYSFGSVATSAGRVYIVFLSTSVSSGQAPAAASVSGAGLSFSEIGAAGGAVYSSGVRRIQAWRALAASGASAGPILVTLNGVTTGLDAVLLELGGVDTSGTNGSGAIVQSASSNARKVRTLSVGLAPFAASANRPLAFFAHRAAEATTEEPGYTELEDGGHTAPVAAAECEWHASSADASPSASWSSVADGGGVAVELRAGS